MRILAAAIEVAAWIGYVYFMIDTHLIINRIEKRLQ